MLTYKSENKKLKKELNDLRHEKEDIEEELKYTKDNNAKQLKVISILTKTLEKFKEETTKNQLGSVINLQNKMKKILADCESELVSSK